MNVNTQMTRIAHIQGLEKDVDLNVLSNLCVTVLINMLYDYGPSL